tara:strand:- start:376 stop:750 length:375 start_codon:yes stop_codon:yes gene_type:complete
MNFSIDDMRVFEVTNDEFIKPSGDKKRFEKNDAEYVSNAAKTAKISKAFNEIAEKLGKQGKKLTSPMMGSGLFAYGKGMEYAVHKNDVALFFAIIAEMKDITVTEIDKDKSMAKMYANAKFTPH